MRFELTIDGDGDAAAALNAVAAVCVVRQARLDGAPVEVPQSNVPALVVEDVVEQPEPPSFEGEPEPEIEPETPNPLEGVLFLSEEGEAYALESQLTAEDFDGTEPETPEGYTIEQVQAIRFKLRAEA